MVATSCKRNVKSTLVLHFPFQIHYPGLQNVALIWIHMSTWGTYFILHFQIVSTRWKRNGKSTVVLHFAFQTYHPGLRNVAPIWILISTWCTFFILHLQMVAPTCRLWIPPKMRGMTAADCNKLQILQNSVNRILTGARVGTRTDDLLFETNTISVHQMIAFSTILMVFKVLN